MEEDIPLVHKFEPFAHQPVEPEPKKKPKKIKNFFPWIWRQIKRHKIVVASVAAVFVVLAVLFIALPVVTIGQYTFVNADTVTRIELGQTAKLKYSNVSVKINKFIADVCPVGTCFGSGPVVDYEFQIDGQKYVDTSLTPNVPVYRFQVQTVKTDNKTYAEIKIIKS
ncbi:MAG: hypothetical protein NTV39_04125 [Candidatus Saccharibacteria bacterium]|nr:hypothetical protein [Candidatus Saccharibacteria bacterium]